MQSNNSGQELMAAGLVFFIIAVGLVVFLFLYLFYSYCYKKICGKAGKDPGAIIWIPFVRYIPLFEIAKLPVWLFILLLLPIVNFVVFLILWIKICEARSKSPLLVILFFVPIANLVVIPYLAFSE